MFVEINNVLHETEELDVAPRSEFRPQETLSDPETRATQAVEYQHPDSDIEMSPDLDSEIAAESSAPPSTTETPLAVPEVEPCRSGHVRYVPGSWWKALITHPIYSTCLFINSFNLSYKSAVTEPVASFRGPSIKKEIACLHKNNT